MVRSTFGVHSPLRANAETLGDLLDKITALNRSHCILDPATWLEGRYRPTPTIVEAAEALYAGHGVESIAHASASAKNLEETSDAVFEVIDRCRRESKLAVCFVTGTPGSGKTLAGLSAVHNPRLRELDSHAAYLSGTRPLVEVLRRALAEDHVARNPGARIGDAKRAVRAEIQPLMGYLTEYLKNQPSHPPHEHVIVFDEAQRAWDADYGFKQFRREKSEPALFLEIMARRKDWAVIVALVGGGQEINRGEGGLREWGNALTEWNRRQSRQWGIYLAPERVQDTGALSSLHDETSRSSIPAVADTRLHLAVSTRSYRWDTTAWVNSLLQGDLDRAASLAQSASGFPIYLTRSLATARQWLTENTRGMRRCGLVASSGARRLVAEGLGVALRSNDLDETVNWFLRERSDFRSSYSLEVTASEYTCQGLELDNVGLCWGGDLIWDVEGRSWTHRKLSGIHWRTSRQPLEQEYAANKYRVLLTRARNSMVIWVPQGDPNDPTRDPSGFNRTAAALAAAGAIPIDDKQG